MMQPILWSLLLLLSVQVCIDCTDNTKSIRLKLYRGESDTNGSDSRFGQTFQQSSGGVFREKLLNHRSKNYFTYIELGQPGQKFKVLLDTGSIYLWVPSKSSHDQKFATKNSFDGTLSKSYQSTGKTGSIGFATTLQVKGKFSSDRLKIAGLTLENQLFLEATEARGGDSLIDLPFDGVLGLNFHPKGDGSSGVMENIMNSLGNDCEQVFSLSLKHQKNSMDAGELLIGDIDASLFTGKILWVPLSRVSGWEIRLDVVGMRVESMSSQKTLSFVCKNGCNAKIDTGFPFIGGPPEDVAHLNEVIGAANIGNGRYGLHRCNFDEIPNLVFRIAGRNVVIAPKYYITKSPTGECHTHLVALPNAKSWVLGESFISLYYTIFDYGMNQVGFARSIYGADGKKRV